MDFLKELLKEASADFARGAEAQLARSRIEAEVREKERAHEKDLDISRANTAVMLSEAKATMTTAAITARSEHARYREWTLRVLGGLGVIGLFSYLIYAVSVGKVTDPIAALPTLATVITALVLLGNNVMPRKRKAPEEDGGDA